MATITDHPFVLANDTWNKVLNSAVTGYPTQDYSAVLDTSKVDSSIAIQPWQIVTNIGALWGNTVDNFMRVSWPVIVGVLNGSIGGLGDFVGPASSTQYGIVRYANGTGKLGLTSTITITDNAGIGDQMSLPNAGEFRTEGTSSIITGAGSAVGPRVGQPGGADTAHVLELFSGLSVNSVATRVFAGNRDPNTFVTGNPGDRYEQVNGDQSTTWRYLAGLAGTGSWVNEQTRSEAAVSGVTSGGRITVASITNVQVNAGTAVLEEYVSPTVIRRHRTSWNTQSIAVSGSGLTDPAAYWVVTDAGYTGTATIAERTVPSTARNEVNLGVSLHASGDVVDTIPAPKIHRDTGRVVREMLSAKLGAIVRSGTVSEIGATLTVQTTDYSLLVEGVNFYNDVQTAHTITAPAENPLTFTSIASDGTPFNDGLNAVPKTWNNGGVETALTGTQAVVHQLVILPPRSVGATDNSLLQLGTTAYADYNTAVANIASEKAKNPLWSVASYLGGRIASIVVNASATVWADASAHVFTDSGDSSGASITTTSYDNLSDTPGPKIGQDGKVPVVDVTEQVHVYADVKGVFVWGSEDNKNTTAGTPILGKQFVEAPRWISQTVKIALQTATSASALTVDVKADGVSIVDGALPSLGIGATGPVTANLLVASRVQGTRLEIEPISTDVDWRGLTVQLIGNTKYNS